MERTGKETHRGVGATPGHVSPALPHHQAEPRTNTTHLTVPRRGRPRYLAQACLEQSFFAVKLAVLLCFSLKIQRKFWGANNGLFWAGETTLWCQCVDGASPALVFVQACPHIGRNPVQRRYFDTAPGGCAAADNFRGLSGLAVRDLLLATGILHWTHAASVHLTMTVRRCEGPGWLSGFRVLLFWTAISWI